MHIDTLEYWEEKDSELEADFPLSSDETSPPPTLPDDPAEEHEILSSEEQAVIWWIVLFTCVFQTLHGLPLKAAEWLMKFLGGWLVFLGQYSPSYCSGFPVNVASESNIFTR